MSDPAFAAAVHVLGSHYVCGYRGPQSNCPSSANAIASGKKVWASENGSDDYNAGAVALARGINRGYIDGKMTAYINWPVIAAITRTSRSRRWASPWPPAVVGQLLDRQERLGDGADDPVHRARLAVPGLGLRLPRRQPRQRQLRVAAIAEHGDYSAVIETMDATASQTFTATVTGGLSTGTGARLVHQRGLERLRRLLVHRADVTPSGGRSR